MAINPKNTSFFNYISIHRLHLVLELFMPASSDFKKYFSNKNLTKLFYEEIRFKSARGIDHVSTNTFETRLTENIEIIHRKVNNGTYQFSQYREKLLFRGSNKFPRVISIPTIRDKLVQKALSEILKSSFIDKMPLLHRIINDVILTYDLNLYDSILRLDVKDFYPSIVHNDLIRELKKKIRKKEILHLVENAISQQTVSHPKRKNRQINNMGVPQGLSISNILANIYLSPIDAKYSSNTKLKYFRYVDDILIFCNELEIKTIHSEIVRNCSNLGLELHNLGDENSKSVSGKITDGFNYLGYEFLNGKITVRKKSIDKIHESIIRLFTNYKYSKTKNVEFLRWALNIRITGCIYNKSKYGWLFFFSQINDLSLLGELDHFVRVQIKRFDIKILEPKKFLRTYHEITRNLSNTTYIPNLDQLSLNDKRKILIDVFKVKNLPKSSNEIEYQFNRRIYKIVTELERDLGRTS